MNNDLTQEEYDAEKEGKYIASQERIADYKAELSRLKTKISEEEAYSETLKCTIIEEHIQLGLFPDDPLYIKEVKNAVPVIVNEAELPDKYFEEEVKRKINKKLINQDWKDGINIEGVEANPETHRLVYKTS